MGVFLEQRFGTVIVIAIHVVVHVDESLFDFLFGHRFAGSFGNPAVGRQFFDVNTEFFEDVFSLLFGIEEYCDRFYGC